MSLPRTVVTFISGAALALSPWASHGAEPGNCFSEKKDLLEVDRDRVGLSEELRSLAQGDEKRFVAFSKTIVDSHKGPGGEEYKDGQWTLSDKAVEVESRSGSDLGLAENHGEFYISLSRKGGGTGGYGSTGDVYGLNEGTVVRSCPTIPSRAIPPIRYAMWVWAVLACPTSWGCPAMLPGG